MVKSGMVSRSALHAQVFTALGERKAILVVGPRQCGKTTLARGFVPADATNYFDLEDPASAAALEQPMLALAGLRGLVVIDEIQRRPELFPVLRVLLDRTPLPAQFLLLGSAAPEVIRHTSESLAGRDARIVMAGFDLAEVGNSARDQLWFRGGFPLAFTAASDDASARWRRDFIQTVVERDMPALGAALPPTTILRLWTKIAHYHGQTWNASEPARSLGISQTSVSRYLDTLDGIFMTRQLLPWHENLNKRQIKSPKVYIRDTGLLHQLLGIASPGALVSHPKVGASWEGFAIDQIVRAGQPDGAYFWATQNGAELDLLMFKNGRRIGVECKYMDAPTVTASMRIAQNDLNLDELIVVYPGARSYLLADDIACMPLNAAMDKLSRAKSK